MTESHMASVPTITDADLLAYLDEALPVDRMTRVEQALRDSAELRHRTASLLQNRDQ